MKKLVILSSRFPYPLEKGDKLRLYHQIKHLSKHFDIHLLSIVESDLNEETVNEVRKFCKSIKYFKLSKFKQALGLGLNLFSKLPYQVRYFFDKKIKQEIEKEINLIKPDAVYCQLIRMATYTVDLKYPKVIDYMDAFSLIMKRRIEDTNNFVKKYFYKLEANRLEQYEISIQNQFVIKTIISPSDREALKSVSGIEVISNGVDSEYYQPKEVEKKYDLLFAGNMGYAPNISAAKYLVNQILNKNQTVLIAGARPPQDVMQLASDRVTVTGWTEDIREAYHRSSIFAAPLFQGAGQQNKILQAMALGVPCVTTSLVNDAIGAKDGKEILIADDQESFRKQIGLLLESSILRDTIARKARTFIDENYRWQQQNQKLVKLISSQINS